MTTYRSSARAIRRGVLFSFMAHCTSLVVLAALLQPLGSGRDRPLALEVTTVEPLPEPQMLIVSEALVPPNAGERLTDSDTDLSALAGEATDVVSSEVRWPTGLGGSGTAVTGQRGSGPGASFFGTVAHGDEFVFVVDMSTSMDHGQGASASEGSRFIRAVAELRSSIERLSDRQSFYVIFFNGQTRRMFDDDALVPQPLPATLENKRKLNDWLAEVRTGESTDPREALRLGLGMRPSALFLLSDGEFNGQQSRLNAGILNGNPSVSDVIDRHNRGSTPIHTIAYEDKACSKAMEQIARSTGGEYKFVPPHQSVVASSVVVNRSPRADLSNQRASYLVSRAESLESRGRWKQALAIYRRIERDFPSTEAAHTAAMKIEQISMDDP